MVKTIRMVSFMMGLGLYVNRTQIFKLKQLNHCKSKKIISHMTITPFVFLLSPMKGIPDIKRS